MKKYSCMFNWEKCKYIYISSNLQYFFGFLYCSKLHTTGYLITFNFLHFIFRGKNYGFEFTAVAFGAAELE